MKTKEELEATAYGIWLTVITRPEMHPLSVMIAQGVLDFLLWCVDENIDALSKDQLDKCMQAALKGIAEDCIKDPIAMIKRDYESRKEARTKAMNAGNN